MSINQLKLYLKTVFRMSFSGRARLVLTSIGIFISVFGFSLALLISSSYFETQRDYYCFANNNTVIVSSTRDTDETIKDLAQYTSVTPSVSADTRSGLPMRSVKIGNSQVRLSGIVHGIETGEVLLHEASDKYCVPVTPTLRSGRMIERWDIGSQSESIIIDEFTATLLYGELDNAVGNSFSLSSQAFIGEAGVAPISYSATVIGVIDNTVLVDQKSLENRKKIESSQESIDVIVDVYIPIDAIYDLFDSNELDRKLVYVFSSEGEASSFLSSVERYAERKQYENIFLSASSKATILSNVENEMTVTKLLLASGLVILSFVFGISLLSVVLFSVKERIPEIGIRKAFGAGKIDIVFQIFGEMVIIAALSSVVAILFSIYVAKVIELILLNHVFIYFKLHISAESILLPIALGIIEAAICGIVPGLYASSVPVTDALRFE